MNGLEATSRLQSLSISTILKYYTCAYTDVVSMLLVIHNKL